MYKLCLNCWKFHTPEESCIFLTDEKTKLPITALLEERRKDLRLYECPECRDMIIDLSDNLIPQVKSLEEAQQKKAKEEEKDRIVGILKSIHNDSEILASKYECSQEWFEYWIQETSTLEKVISLITSNQ